MTHITQTELDRLMRAFLSPLNQTSLGVDCAGISLEKHFHIVFHDSMENSHELREFPSLALKMMEELNAELQKLGLEKVQFDIDDDLIH